MTDPGTSCTEPSRGPLLADAGDEVDTRVDGTLPKEKNVMQARVGKPAPDFEATAFVGGGFKKLKLSDFKGQWVVLCFYPGDFTFV